MIKVAINTKTADTTIGIHRAERPTMMTASRNGGRERRMRRRYNMRHLTLTVACVTLWACGDSVPETVFVPGPGYQQSLRISASLDSASSVRVDAWLDLHARRESGQWQAVPKAKAKLADCWWGGPPPVSEREVAASVRWIVAPSDSVRFNLPQPPGMERRVRFARPGRYLLWAQSNGCRVLLVSDTIAVHVRP